MLTSIPFSGGSMMKCHVHLLLMLFSCGAARAQTDKTAFIPKPILPGGLVLPLYPPNSERLSSKLREITIFERRLSALETRYSSGAFCVTP
jgi:hypothetical protein